MDKSTHYPPYECPLLPGNFYHVYNRTNNGEPLFKSPENRRYFLEKFGEYLLPYLTIYAYCLLDNHFHFLVRIREELELEKQLNSLSVSQHSAVQKKLLEQVPDLRTWDELTSSQFHRFFTCYAMSVNKEWGRKGNLFYRPFQRVPVQHESHFTRLIYYIHANSKKHGLQSDFRNYPWNSYATMLSDNPTKLERQVVLDWFGGKSAFELFHQQAEEWKDIEGLIIEW